MVLLPAPPPAAALSYDQATVGDGEDGGEGGTEGGGDGSADCSSASLESLSDTMLMVALRAYPGIPRAASAGARKGVVPLVRLADPRHAGKTNGVSGPLPCEKDRPQLLLLSTLPLIAIGSGPVPSTSAVATDGPANVSVSVSAGGGGSKGWLEGGDGS